MEKIKNILVQVTEMLRQASKGAQADWLDERLQEMKSKDTAGKALKEVKSIIAGMGSLSDTYLELEQEQDIDEAKYNAIFQELIGELDEEIEGYLTGRKTGVCQFLVEASVAPVRFPVLYAATDTASPCTRSIVSTRAATRS